MIYSFVLKLFRSKMDGKYCNLTTTVAKFSFHDYAIVKMYSRKVFPTKILITKLTWLLCKICKIISKMQIRFFYFMMHFLLNENNLLELYPHIENRQMSQAEIFYSWVLQSVGYIHLTFFVYNFISDIPSCY